MERKEASGGDETFDPDRHVTVLSALNFLTAGIVALGGFAAVWGTLWLDSQQGTWVPPGVPSTDLFGSAAVFLAGATILLLVPILLAGIGLAQRAEWGRVLGLAVAAGLGLIGVLSILGSPLLGILFIAYAGYALWALTREPMQAVFRSGARSRSPPGVN